MSQINFTWRKGGRYQVTAYSGNRKEQKDQIYNNIMGKDPNAIAQVLLDLELVDSFPIEKAVKIYMERRRNKDWLGF